MNKNESVKRNDISKKKYAPYRTQIHGYCLPTNRSLPIFQADDCNRQPKSNHHFKKVAVPEEVYKALNCLLIQERWNKKDLFVELISKTINPLLTLSSEFIVVYNWANESSKENERFELLLRGFDNGFYVQQTSQEQLQEYIENLKHLSPNERNSALDAINFVVDLYNLR